MSTTRPLSTPDLAAEPKKGSSDESSELPEETGTRNEGRTSWGLGYHLTTGRNGRFLRLTRTSVDAAMEVRLLEKLEVSWEDERDAIARADVVRFVVHAAGKARERAFSTPL
jgi:hypothetical protein